MKSTYFSEQDRLFYKDGYLLGKQVKNKNLLSGAIESMYEAIDQLIESLLKMAARNGIRVDCRKGCSRCCQQPVFANSYELQFLGEFVKKKFSPEEQAAILRRAKEKNYRTSQLSGKAILNNKMPCPLLKDSACSVYPVRPLACRIYLSTRLSSCIQFYNQPEAPDSIPELLGFPLRAGRMMNQGFFDALKENSLFSSELRIEEGIAGYLESGDLL